MGIPRNSAFLYTTFVSQVLEDALNMKLQLRAIGFTKDL